MMKMGMIQIEICYSGSGRMSVTSSTKIMILYASYGDGHYQVAKALREKFLENGVHNIVMIDLFKERNFPRSMP